ncbi:MAG TPA: 30S ribosomal protein S13 [Candidatus Paceibacterota bacterium]
MRFAGITIPENKRIEIGLTSVFGIGRNLAHKILDEAKIEYGFKPKEISANNEAKIRKVIGKYKVEGDLKREISGNIKRLKDIKSYRGNRHIRKLPVNGQRTKSNSRTVRGNVRKTMGSGKRKLEKK